MPRNFFLIVCVAILPCIFLLNTGGCIKEYSYERTPLDTIPITDTADTTITKAIYSQCPLCKKDPDYALGKWSFMVDTFSFCGNITGAVMLGARTAFTFFGPSACSTDSGLVITCYLDNPFNAEATNVNVDRTTLRYYNHLGTHDMFIADISLGFSLTIVSYSETTGIMKGFFSGLVYTDRNDIAQIQNGKFEVQF